MKGCGWPRMAPGGSGGAGAPGAPVGIPGRGTTMGPLPPGPGPMMDGGGLGPPMSLVGPRRGGPSSRSPPPITL